MYILLVYDKRIYDFLADIKKNYINKNILVGHGGVIKAIECYANKMLDNEEIGPFLPDNSKILKYKFKLKKYF